MNPATLPDLTQPAGWMPLVFLVLMGLAMLIYVILDGYDLGVGVLLRRANDADKDRMIASIGPFWDANETWLVLGVGLLLTAFPLAHGAILGAPLPARGADAGGADHPRRGVRLPRQGARSATSRGGTSRSTRARCWPASSQG